MALKEPYMRNACFNASFEVAEKKNGNTRISVILLLKTDKRMKPDSLRACIRYMKADAYRYLGRVPNLCVGGGIVLHDAWVQISRMDENLFLFETEKEIYVPFISVCQMEIAGLQIQIRDTNSRIDGNRRGLLHWAFRIDCSQF